MFKGVMVAFGVIIAVALIPIVHFIGIPFGPFIGGYYGIISVGPIPGSTGRQSLALGSIVGLLMFIVFVIGAVIVTVFSDFNHALLWAGVVVFTFYYATMAGLGAWYGALRATS